MDTDLLKLKLSLLERGLLIARKPDEPVYNCKCGAKLRFFFNSKEAVLDPEMLKSIVLCMGEKKLHGDKIASSSFVGTAIASVFSALSNVRQIIVDKDKIHGNCNGFNLLYVEGFATKGTSILSAVNFLRRNGGICSHCIVVVDSEDGAGELLKSNGVELHSLIKKSELYD